MPESVDNTKAEESSTRARDRTNLLFWLSVWIGTTWAGGVFGFLLGCGGGLKSGILYSIIGVVFAATFGAFIIAHVAFVTWCLWLSRFRVAAGGLAGCLTGVVSTLSIVLGLPPTDVSWKASVLAGVLGMLGGGLAGGSYHSLVKAKGLYQASLQHRWRFSLRSLFIRVTVISALLAVYAWFINLIWADQP